MEPPNLESILHGHAGAVLKPIAEQCILRFEVLHELLRTPIQVIRHHKRRDRHRKRENELKRNLYHAVVEGGFKAIEDFKDAVEMEYKKDYEEDLKDSIRIVGMQLLQAFENVQERLYAELDKPPNAYDEFNQEIDIGPLRSAVEQSEAARERNELRRLIASINQELSK